MQSLTNSKHTAGQGVLLQCLEDLILTDIMHVLTDLMRPGSWMHDTHVGCSECCSQTATPVSQLVPLQAFSLFHLPFLPFTGHASPALPQRHFQGRHRQGSLLHPLPGWPQHSWRSICISCCLRQSHPRLQACAGHRHHRCCRAMPNRHLWARRASLHRLHQQPHHTDIRPHQSCRLPGRPWLWLLPIRQGR